MMKSIDTNETNDRHELLKIFKWLQKKNVEKDSAETLGEYMNSKLLP